MLTANNSEQIGFQGNEFFCTWWAGPTKFTVALVSPNSGTDSSSNILVNFCAINSPFLFSSPTHVGIFDRIPFALSIFHSFLIEMVQRLFSDEAPTLA